MKLRDVREGDCTPGDCGAPIDQIPVWMDREKFNRGRQFFINHVAAVSLALHCSLVSGLSILNLLEPLVFTKKSDTPEKAFKRYFQTFLHIVLWHVDDVWHAPNGKAHRSVKLVRKMHNSVAHRMNKGKREGQKLFLSQYDMGLVQSGFFGAVIMYPEDFGIKCTRDELSDYVFFWRCLGYLLGVSDRYNICSGGLDDAYNVCREIERDLLLPALKTPPKDFDKMSLAYMRGTNIPSGFEVMTREALFAVMCHGWGLTVPSLNFLDSLRYYYVKTVTFLTRWCPLFERIINYVAMRKFYQEVNQLKL